MFFGPVSHAIATGGVFTPLGTFLCLPGIDKQLMLDVWQDKAFEMFAKVGQIDPKTLTRCRRILNWPSLFASDATFQERMPGR